MPKIVIPVTTDSEDGFLLDMDDVLVLDRVEDAVYRLGTWPGRIYAVWEHERLLTPAEGAQWATATTPSYLVVFAPEGMLLRLHDMYTSKVTA
jgi:hypothetical protein